MNNEQAVQARLRMEGLVARRVRGMRGSEIREAFKLTERPDLISLAGGFPDEAAFPLDEVVGLVERLISRNGGLIFQYGPTEGLSGLRSRVAQEMGRLGVAVRPEEVLLTSGSQQALDLIGRVFLDPGDVVLVESPGYVGGLSAFAAYEARLVGVELDREGLVPEDLEGKLRQLRREGARVKLLYTVPTYQNPTGTCLPSERRAALLDLAAEHGFLIVEDDPYREISFGAPPPLPLAAAGTGNVLYLGSFSKVFLPGLRVGWVAGPASLLAHLSLAKQPADLCSNMFGQWLVEAYLAEGLLAPRTAMLRREYRARRDALHQALQGEDLPAAWELPEGGFFLWVTLPEQGNARRLLATAREEGVAFVPGEAFCVGERGRRSLRLAYSQASPERLREAAARLGRAVRAHLAKEAGFGPASANSVGTPACPAGGAAVK
ncbi:MAG: PLP-dependent aminotransferase family protein [Betaproteobacteria bacterium]